MLNAKWRLAFSYVHFFENVCLHHVEQLTTLPYFSFTIVQSP